MIGAGTGLIYILRWFWWRINAYTEIVAMISSLLIAFYLNFGELQVADWSKIIIGAVLTTLYGWSLPFLHLQMIKKHCKTLLIK